MNIYLESVSVDEIRNAAAAGLADGVAFSHAAVGANAFDASTRERLEEISRECAFPICVPVGAVTSDDIYTEARELAKVSDHVVVQIPLVEDSLVPMTRLTAEGVMVCATFVFSAAQAIIAASPRSAVQFTECALAGADIICLTPEALRNLVVHPFSDRGIDKFLSELSRRP